MTLSTLARRAAVYAQSLRGLTAGQGSAGTSLTVDKASYLSNISAGALIATLVDPFGAGSNFSIVGVAPGELDLASGGRIVAGRGAQVVGARPTIVVRAANGKRAVEEPLSFNVRAEAVTPTPAPTPAPTPTPSTTPTPTPALRKPGQIGFNRTTDFGQGLPTFQYLNRMKSSSYNGPWNNGATISQYGYPQSAGTGGRDTATFVSLHRPNSGTIRYVLRHNGSNLVWHWAAQALTIVDQTDPNRVIFDVGPAPGDEPVIVFNSADVWPDYRPNNPAGSQDGIVIVELQHEAALLAGKQFYPEAIAAEGKYWGERWMDVLRINDSVVRTLADRITRHNCSYVSEFGPPLDVVIDLMNEAKSELFWNNLHYAASIEYQRWHLQLLHDRLDPAIRIINEYHNEPWNYGAGFAHGFAYMEDTGKAMVPQKGNPQGYGYKAAQMAALAREIFADQPDRLFTTANLQGDAPANYAGVAEGAALAGYDIGEIFDAVCIAAYTSGGAQDLAGFEQDPVKIKMLMDEVERFEATNADPALRTVSQDLIDQMRHGVSALGWPNSITLDSLRRVSAELANFCREHAIRHAMIYEFQDPHTSMYLIGEENGRRFNIMMEAFQSDPRVSGIQAGSYERDRFAYLRANGVTGTMVLTDLGPNNQYGAWRTKQDFLSPDTPLWAFYEWYNDNAPDQVLFELNIVGNPQTNVDREVDIRVSSYGGLFPTQTRHPVIKTGALPPGLTYANGRITGKPTQTGDTTLVFKATDAGGREVEKSLTIEIAAKVDGKRYIHLRVFASVKDEVRFGQPGNTDGNFILGEFKAKGQDGEYLDRSVWTASGPFLVGGYGDRYPPSNALDNNAGSAYSNPKGQLVEVVFFTGESNPIKPGSFEMVAGGIPSYAPGDFEIFWSDDGVNAISLAKVKTRTEYPNGVLPVVPVYAS